MTVEGRLVGRPTRRSTARSSTSVRALRLQARVRRASALGLPRRHARRPRGRRVRGLRGDGLADRAADGPRDGPFGPGMCSCGSTPTRGRPAGPLPRRRPRRTPHGRLRRRGEQRRPQDRAPAADPTATCTAATTASASPTSTSCAPSCGSGAARTSPTRRSRHCAGSGGRSPRRPGRAAERC